MRFENLMGIGFQKGQFCEILSHSVSYGMYVKRGLGLKSNMKQMLHPYTIQIFIEKEYNSYYLKVMSCYKYVTTSHYAHFNTYCFHSGKRYFSLTLCVMGTPKQVLWQTVKAQMKCRRMWHFLKVCTVC